MSLYGTQYRPENCPRAELNSKSRRFGRGCRDLFFFLCCSHLTSSNSCCFWFIRGTGNDLHVRERGEGGKSSTFLKITEQKCHACGGREQERHLAAMSRCAIGGYWEEMARKQQGNLLLHTWELEKRKSPTSNGKKTLPWENRFLGNDSRSLLSDSLKAKLCHVHPRNGLNHICWEQRGVASTIGAAYPQALLWLICWYNFRLNDSQKTFDAY